MGERRRPAADGECRRDVDEQTGQRSGEHRMLRHTHNAPQVVNLSGFAERNAAAEGVDTVSNWPGHPVPFAPSPYCVTAVTGLGPWGSKRRLRARSTGRAWRRHIFVLC